jgi:hypothetical protein
MIRSLATAFCPLILTSCGLIVPIGVGQWAVSRSQWIHAALVSWRERFALPFPPFGKIDDRFGSSVRQIVNSATVLSGPSVGR